MLREMDRATRSWSLPIIGREKGRFLARLIDRERPARALEIGSLIGYSAILIAGHLPPRGRLICLEVSPYMARITEQNAIAADLGDRVKVVTGDARSTVARVPGRFDFVLIDAAKSEYLDYLRALEPRLAKGAWVVADNTGIFERALRDYLAHVRRSGRYESREENFGDDAMEVSRFLA